MNNGKLLELGSGWMVSRATADVTECHIDLKARSRADSGAGVSGSTASGLPLIKQASSSLPLEQNIGQRGWCHGPESQNNRLHGIRRDFQYWEVSGIDLGSFFYITRPQVTSVENNRFVSLNRKPLSPIEHRY